MNIRAHIDIDAAADDVWDVVGRGFAEIDAWATTVPSSRATAGADGRVCAVNGTLGIDAIVERLTSYDDGEHTLTYVTDAVMPGYVLAAQNTWPVRPLGSGRSRVSLAAEVRLAEWRGSPADPHGPRSAGATRAP